MLFIQWPYMILALPVVILIEAALCRRWFNIDWSNALRITGKAQRYFHAGWFSIDVGGIGRT